MSTEENPEKIILVTEPVYLKVIGSKIVEEEVVEDLVIPDPDPEIAKAILNVIVDQV